MDKITDPKTLVGKTIKAVDPVPVHEAHMSRFIMVFTDGTYADLFLGGLSPEKARHIRNEVFLPLWDSAGTARYDKSKWKELDDLLTEIGMRGGGR